MKILVIISGPTASGKTGLAIEIAKAFNTEILSADSRQFYKEMTIGTAKPSEEELASVKHHFINTLSIEQDYSAGDFERDAISLLTKMFEEKDVAVMAGGSGLFIRAVIEGLDEFPDVPKEIEEELETQFRRKGLGYIQRELKSYDLEYYNQVDRSNPRRMIRALGVVRTAGKPYSSYLSQEKKQRDFEVFHVNVDWDREELYERINKRVDQMMEAGLEAEAKALLPHRDLKALLTVGYQELFDAFEGEYSLERAVELVKRNSRRYAKRQMTWFRKERRVRFYPPGSGPKIIEELQQALAEK